MIWWVYRLGVTREELNELRNVLFSVEKERNYEHFYESKVSAAAESFVLVACLICYSEVAGVMLIVLNAHAPTEHKSDDSKDSLQGGSSSDIWQRLDFLHSFIQTVVCLTTGP